MLSKTKATGMLMVVTCIAVASCGSSGDDAPAANGGAGGRAAAAAGEPGDSGKGGRSVGSAGKPSDGGEGGLIDGGGAGGSPVEAEVLDPPPTIDLALCEDASGSPDACDFCCNDNGFTSSSTYQGKCVCGIHSENDAECATETPTQCFGCCAAAGYSATKFTAGDPSQCTCQNKFDTELCVTAKHTAEPAPACAICCLNNGFISSDYDVANGGVCKCSSG